MNFRELQKALPSLLKHRVVPFLWGSEGIGKTQFMTQYCAALNLQLVKLNTASQEVGDLIGLQIKDDVNKTAYHTRPEWFPTGGQGVIFLDELNRAPTEVKQALFPFINEGMLHTHKLPVGWRVVAAGNYDSDRFTTVEMADAAWTSRFCHLDVQPAIEDWVLYAESRGANNVANFIREQPKMLGLENKGSLNLDFVSPNPRAMLEFVGMLDEDTELADGLRYEIYQGLIGRVAAASYITWSNNKERNITLHDVVHSYDKIKGRLVKQQENKHETRFDLYTQSIAELRATLLDKPDFLAAPNYLINIKEFIADLPSELSLKVLTELSEITRFYGKDAIVNDLDFIKRCRFDVRVKYET